MGDRKQAAGPPERRAPRPAPWPSPRVRAASGSGRASTARATALPLRAREHPSPGTRSSGGSGCRRAPAPARELAAYTHPLGILFFFTMTREVRGSHDPGNPALRPLPEQTLGQLRPVGNTPRRGSSKPLALARRYRDQGRSDRLALLSSSHQPRQRGRKRSAPKIPESARSLRARDPAG